MAAKEWNEGFQKIREGVYAYVTSGVTLMSNCGLVVGDKAALVWDSLINVEYTSRFVEEAKKVTDKPLKYVVFSHNHGDHIEGHKALGPDIVKIGHKNLKAHITNELSQDQAKKQRRFPHMNWDGVAYDYPDLYVDDHLAVDLGGRVVDICYAGHCHSNCDLVGIVRDEGVVFCGDILFSYVCPATTIANIDQWISFCDRLCEMNADTYVPGHGPISTKMEIRKMQCYLQICKDVAVGLNAGKTDDEIIDALELGEYEYVWKEPNRIYSNAAAIADRMRGEDFLFERHLAAMDKKLKSQRK